MSDQRSVNFEHCYAIAMRQAAKREGHKRRFPGKKPTSPNTSPTNFKSMVMEYFAENQEPVFREELSKILDVEADKLRRICRSLVLAGKLMSRRTQTGVIYAPKDD